MITVSVPENKAGGQKQTNKPVIAHVPMVVMRLMRATKTADVPPITSDHDQRINKGFTGQI